MKTVLIISDGSGTGKTTLAKQLNAGGINIVSSDNVILHLGETDVLFGKRFRHYGKGRVGAFLWDMSEQLRRRLLKALLQRIIANAEENHVTVVEGYLPEFLLTPLVKLLEHQEIWVWVASRAPAITLE